MTTQSAALPSQVKLELDQILANSSGQTDVLWSNDFTQQADRYLSTLSSELRESTLQVLNGDDSEYPYFHSTHDFSVEPFDEDDTCRHGLTRDTCPCGCGEY